jgi:hypothetical protein
MRVVLVSFRFCPQPTALAVGSSPIAGKSPRDGTIVADGTVLPSPGDLSKRTANPPLKRWAIGRDGSSCRRNLKSDKLL